MKVDRIDWEQVQHGYEYWANEQDGEGPLSVIFAEIQRLVELHTTPPVAPSEAGKRLREAIERLELETSIIRIAKGEGSAVGIEGAATELRAIADDLDREGEAATPQSFDEWAATDESRICPYATVDDFGTGTNWFENLIRREQRRAWQAARKGRELFACDREGAVTEPEPMSFVQWNAATPVDEDPPCHHESAYIEPDTNAFICAVCDDETPDETVGRIVRNERQRAWSAAKMHSTFHAGAVRKEK